MRKITTWVSTCCLACLATILLVLIASHLLVHIRRAIQPGARSSLLMLVSQHNVRAHQLSVFEAIVDNSYEIFIADDLTSQTRQLTTHFANDRFPVLSPDGNQVAFVSWRTGDSEIYLIDLATGATRNLSNHAGRDGLPAWSPDGSMLAYTSRRDGNDDIYLVDVARGLTQNLTRSLHHDSQPAWSPDGQQLIFVSDRDGVSRRYALDLGGRNLTVYRAESQWQTAQNTGKLDVTQGTIPG